MSPVPKGLTVSGRGGRHYKINDGASSAERGTWCLNAFNREKVGCPGGFRVGMQSEKASGGSGF